MLRPGPAAVILSWRAVVARVAAVGCRVGGQVMVGEPKQTAVVNRAILVGVIDVGHMPGERLGQFEPAAIASAKELL